MNAGRPFPSVTRRPLGLTHGDVLSLCHPLSLPGSFIKANFFSLCFSQAAVASSGRCSVVSDSDRPPWLFPRRGHSGTCAVGSEGDLALWVLVGYPSVVQERIHQEGDRGVWKMLLSFREAAGGVAFSVLLSWDSEGQAANQPIVFCCHRKAVILGQVAPSAGSLSIG